MSFVATFGENDAGIVGRKNASCVFFGGLNRGFLDFFVGGGVLFCFFLGSHWKQDCSPSLLAASVLVAQTIYKYLAFQQVH